MSVIACICTVPYCKLTADTFSFPRTILHQPRNGKETEASTPLYVASNNRKRKIGGPEAYGKAHNRNCIGC